MKHQQMSEDGIEIVSAFCYSVLPTTRNALKIILKKEVTLENKQTNENKQNNIIERMGMCSILHVTTFTPKQSIKQASKQTKASRQGQRDFSLG